MKQKFLLMLCTSALVFTTQANDDLWLDVNFTRDSTAWLAAVPELAANGLNMQTSLNGSYFDLDADGEPDFGMNGAFGTFAVNNYSYTPYNLHNLNEQFKYAFRMHNNDASYWAFPGTSNLGSITINFLCGNATNGAIIYVQKFAGMREIPGEDGGEPTYEEIWEDFNPAITLEAPPHEFSTSSFADTAVVNLTEPSRLRFKGPTNKNIHIFAVTFTKNPNSEVQQISRDQLNLQLNGRVLQITDNIAFHATIINMAGMQIGQFKQGENYTFQTPGSYIIRVESATNVAMRKIVVY